MTETSAARLGGFLRSLAAIFRQRTAAAPKPSLPAPTSTPLGPRDIQARLIALGLLDPPADGVLGPLSRWALGEACRSVGVVLDEGSLTTPAMSAALACARPLPLTPGSDLAGR